MTIAEQELAMIGFGGSRPEPAVWGVVRLDPATHAECDARDPGASEALMHWRKLLAPGRGRSPYRIRRIEI